MRHSEHRPKSVKQEKWIEWCTETSEKINDPKYPYSILLQTSEIRQKALEVGIASCWLREKWRQDGYTEAEIWDKQHSWGRKAIFWPTSIWKLAKKDAKNN